MLDAGALAALALPEWFRAGARTLRAALRWRRWPRRRSGPLPSPRRARPRSWREAPSSCRHMPISAARTSRARVSSGSAVLGTCLQHQLERDARHEFEGRHGVAERTSRRRRAAATRPAGRSAMPTKAVTSTARARKQFARRRGDDAERAFGADEQLLQVVAGVVLAQRLKPSSTRAVGQHDLEAEHQVAHHAVAQHCGAARVGREIAAELAANLPSRALIGNSRSAAAAASCTSASTQPASAVIV